MNKIKLAIVVAEFNKEITNEMLKTAISHSKKLDMHIMKMAEVCSDIDNYGKYEFLKKFRSPGHVHLLIAANELLKERSGHTELSIQLMKLANLVPTAVICEMLDSDTGGALTVDKAIGYSSRFNIPLVESLQIKESCVN